MSFLLTLIFREKKGVKGGTIDLDNGTDMRDDDSCDGTERTVCDFNSSMYFIAVVDLVLVGNAKVHLYPGCSRTLC